MMVGSLRLELGFSDLAEAAGWGGVKWQGRLDEDNGTKHFIELALMDGTTPGLNFVILEGSLCYCRVDIIFFKGR
jgi:hypothetical protein